MVCVLTSPPAEAAAARFIFVTMRERWILATSKHTYQLELATAPDQSVGMNVPPETSARHRNKVLGAEEWKGESRGTWVLEKKPVFRGADDADRTSGHSVTSLAATCSGVIGDRHSHTLGVPAEGAHGGSFHMNDGFSVVKYVGGHLVGLVVGACDP